MRYTRLALLVGLIGCKANDGAERARPSEELVEAATASARHAELSSARPIFVVRSLSESQHYYRDKLGFRLDWDHGDPPDFGSVSRSELVLFISEGGHGQSGSWALAFARDVDKLYKELTRRGALIKMPPTNMPWGLREMHVADPDGNVIRFGTGIKD
jgi:catechol 2,3-dioxygenase-like lactoylglutathione lyase family enzyme